MKQKNSDSPEHSSLIEHWFPFQEISIECQRERTAMNAFPPLNYLHVWWARRPLIACRSAILASVLPPEVPHESFLQWLGISGTILEESKRIDDANRQPTKVKTAGFSYPRAFESTLNAFDQDAVAGFMHSCFGGTPTLLDPMAGGGAIPFEATRLGLNTIFNDLNPVASIIEDASITFPIQFSHCLYDRVKYYADVLVDAAQRELEPLFPKEDQELVHAYLWARTLECPTCQLIIPLSPNWWLSKTKSQVYLELQVPPHGSDQENPAHTCSFRIRQVHKNEELGAASAQQGTMKRGAATCPRCGQSLRSHQVKHMAQCGNLGQQLIAKVIHSHRQKKYVLPTQEDTQALEQAQRYLATHWDRWIEKDVLPIEPFPEPCADPRPIKYGMKHWYDFFAPRQLVTLCVYVEILKDCIKPLLAKEIQNKPLEKAIMTYLSLGISKAANFNSRFSIWNSVRRTIANTFDRHDFSFKSSHAEFDGARQLLPWALHQQVLPALKRILKLLQSNQTGRTTVQGYCKDAACLTPIPDGSIDLIVTDPPYHDNVMYAELSDFFYVWLKRVLKEYYPDYFEPMLTNKIHEAVANVSLFDSRGDSDSGRNHSEGTVKGDSAPILQGYQDKGEFSKKEKADQNYQYKLSRIFKEAHRMLNDRGIYVLMFTHNKKVAWKALLNALVSSNFLITASWPLKTESKYSFHQFYEKSINSTILLICRKKGCRPTSPIPHPLDKSTNDESCNQQQNELHSAIIEQRMELKRKDEALKNATDAEWNWIRTGMVLQYLTEIYSDQQLTPLNEAFDTLFKS